MRDGAPFPSDGGRGWLPKHAAPHLCYDVKSGHLVKQYERNFGDPLRNFFRSLKVIEIDIIH